jgi:hypothetical protein
MCIFSQLARRPPLDPLSFPSPRASLREEIKMKTRKQCKRAVKKRSCILPDVFLGNSTHEIALISLSKSG